ncbi:MAG: phosphoribosylanthranilate isomerase [Desulfuromonadales bacterium]|nr:phosphoribosylanthranilate isomerase [Desulfuromonadales bacterium]
MPRVKICGITNIEDARHASECGADALGFVFYPGSSRFIDPDRARRIIAELPPLVSTVGLFVNEHPARIREMVEFCGLNTVQLHGDEEPDQCCYPPCRVIKALRLKSTMESSLFASYQVSALLLDAYVPNQLGGTGHCCDWEQAATIAAQHRVILAGGLNPENVAEAVRQVHPYGVDVSSGIEVKPGQKDPEKVARFIRMAKEALLSELPTA